MDAIDVAVATPPPATRARAWLPVAVGASIIAVLLLRFGPEPFVDAFRRLDAWTLAAAAAVAAASTVCAAYRWHVVAAGLRVPVGMGAAVRAYYMSQFLNATLPGGILGDVHRGLRQRRHGYPLGRSLRAVAWERTLGQLAQVLLTVAVLAALPSPLRPPAVVGLLLAAG
ncbi:MAG TPA: lysylphosphatidylglycerol synthase transmembrane domain-containing protein, partial [Nakamurella sp.]|nr:lysylphosphatidylglycerol synthase transmembrane domain-containing protein [Nakamurella sp.]